MTNKLNFDGLRRNVASTAGFIPNVLAQMNTPEVSSEMTSLTINLKTPYTINRFQISTSFVGKKDQTDGNQNTSTSINIHRHICRGILNDRFIVSDTAAENEPCLRVSSLCARDLFVVDFSKMDEQDWPDHILIRLSDVARQTEL